MKYKFSHKFLCIFIFLSSIVSPIICAQESEEGYLYRLGAGDQLNIKVFNQKDLTGEYTINGVGNLSLPLIGTIKAQNLSIKELEDVLANKLKPDYLLNPQINIEVINYRPYYILGEINSAGSYPYVSGMTYLNSVAIAGGFTYRAKKSYAIVIRSNDPDQKEIEVQMDMLVMPGDIIHIDERLF